MGAFRGPPARAGAHSCPPGQHEVVRDLPQGARGRVLRKGEEQAEEPRAGAGPPLLLLQGRLQGMPPESAQGQGGRRSGRRPRQGAPAGEMLRLREGPARGGVQVADGHGDPALADRVQHLLRRQEVPQGLPRQAAPGGRGRVPHPKRRQRQGVARQEPRKRRPAAGAAEDRPRPQDQAHPDVRQTPGQGL